MITFTYVFLHILLLYVFYKYSLKFKKKQLQYWKIASIPIIFFHWKKGLDGDVLLIGVHIMIHTTMVLKRANLNFCLKNGGVCFII